jgi:hypothetical protein
MFEANAEEIQHPQQQEPIHTETAIQRKLSPSEELILESRMSVDMQKFRMQQRMARLFFQSGLFADIKGKSEADAIAAAFTKIAIGESMGFTPAESMQGIDIVQGRPTIGASLRAARMQRAGFSWQFLRFDDKGCELKVYGPTGVELGVCSFTHEDAARSGLVGKDNYKKNPKNMYFARCITNAQRWYAPGCLSADILSTEEAVDLEPYRMEPAEIPMPTRKSDKKDDAPPFD